MHFDPKKKGLVVLSFGAGQDSTTILYRLIQEPKVRAKALEDRNFAVVFADTGNERPETYDHAWYIYNICRYHGIKFAHLASPETVEMHRKNGRDPSHLLTGYESRTWTSLGGQYRRNSSLAVRNNKSCTDNLKIRPIYRWLDHLCDQLMDNDGKGDRGKRHILEYTERYGRIRMMIGFTKGEEKRIKKSLNFAGAKWFSKIARTFPLADWGFDRLDCINYMQQSKFNDCPPSMCMMCPNVTKHSLIILWHEHRWEFIEWCRHERRKAEKWIPIQKAKGKRHVMALGRKYNLIEELRMAMKELAHMSYQEIKDYHFTHGHCISNGY
jgi:3'-phosphoadenosine 5'-phosphosulfate sulfotransferase (PAPS reductase)/FAD synthetase